LGQGSRAGYEFHQRQEFSFFLNDQTDFEENPASYSVGAESFPRVETAGD